MASFEEGEFYMRTDGQEVKVLSVADLGAGNEGSLAPSEDEAEALKDVASERYYGPFDDESGCMDDRLEGLLIRLAGNRAVTEVVAGYMDRHVEAVSQSRAFARKVNELVTMGRVPVFHEKCAALANQREALRYAARHEDEVVAVVWEKMERLGASEFITEQQVRTAIQTGAKRAEDDSLWDATPEELMQIAQENGARIEGVQGEHHIAGNLDNMSELGFDNGRFRTEHHADDGEDLGLLNVSWVGYRNQLLQDGFSEEDTAKILMRAAVFNVSVQKLINKDGSPLVTVG